MATTKKAAAAKKAAPEKKAAAPKPVSEDKGVSKEDAAKSEPDHAAASGDLSTKVSGVLSPTAEKITEDKVGDLVNRDKTRGDRATSPGLHDDPAFNPDDPNPSGAVLDAEEVADVPEANHPPRSEIEDLIGTQVTAAGETVPKTAHGIGHNEMLTPTIDAMRVGVAADKRP